MDTIWSLLNLKKPLWLTYYDYLSENYITNKIVNLTHYFRPNLIITQEYQNIVNDPIYIDDKCEVAYMNHDAVYVNHNFLKNKTYGAKRFVLFHELQHKKYHDHIGGVFLYFFTSVVVNTSLMKFIRFLNLLSIKNVILSCISGTAISLYIINMYVFYIELRTDINAAEKIQCYKCIDEWSNVIERESIYKGYLGKKELKLINQYYQKDNVLCQHHQ